MARDPSGNVRRDALERRLYEQVRIYGCTGSYPDTWRVGCNGGAPDEPEDTECPGCGEPGYDVATAQKLLRPSPAN